MHQVNRRLETEEKISGDGDPAFPKAQWPTLELCPLCRLPSLQKDADIMWNRDEVYRCSFMSTVLLPACITTDFQA